MNDTCEKHCEATAFNIVMRGLEVEIARLKEALAQEKALQILHDENERLGLYKDAYADLEQKPVAHLWECLGRWSAYLVTNGTQAECAPPSWLVDAVKNATTPPQRTWVGLEEKDMPTDPDPMYDHKYFTAGMVYAANKLMEKNT
jgi:hypothetical protein